MPGHQAEHITWRVQGGTWLRNASAMVKNDVEVKSLPHIRQVRRSCRRPCDSSLGGVAVVVVPPRLGCRGGAAEAVAADNAVEVGFVLARASEDTAVEWRGGVRLWWCRRWHRYGRRPPCEGRGYTSTAGHGTGQLGVGLGAGSPRGSPGSTAGGLFGVYRQRGREGWGSVVRATDCLLPRGSLRWALSREGGRR